MEKEPVTKFDLEAAFKALDELDIPVAEKGIAANRVNLNETFANARNKKLKTELLVEDYYDLNSNEDLEQAQADRDEEIAKAKLARIEKIVDLDADSPEDLLPSYVGKVIIQCPQCMTLFYKDPADIEPSEDDESVVNINEVCQHCGNASGYNVIGKVDAVSENEASDYDASEAGPEESTEEDELSLDFGEPTEEVDAEGTGEAEVAEETPAEESTEETEDELSLDFNEPEEEEEEEEKKEESLNLSKVQKDAAEGSELETENHSENLTLNEDKVTVLNPYDAAGEKDEELEAWLDSGEKEFKISRKPGDGSLARVKQFLLSKGLNSVQSEGENKEDIVTLDDGRKIIIETVVEESVNRSEVQKDAAEKSELETENHSTNLTLNEDDDVLASAPLADMPKAPVTNYFLDCSGSWGPDGWKKEKEEIERLRYDETKGLAKVKVFYFSDKVYDNMADARRSGASNGAAEIAHYAKAHPEEKCIVRTDDDYKGQCSPEDVKDLETLPNIELRLRGINEELTEDVDLNKKLKEHNDYIAYLQKMIEQEEEALKKADNELVKEAITRRLEALGQDLANALPADVKDEVMANDLPTPEEAGADETPVDESVNKSENTAEIAKDELPDAKTLHEEVVTVTVDSEPGREPIVSVTTTDGTPAVEEPIAEPVCVGPECETPCVGPECETPCVGPECDVVPPVIADVPAVEIPTEISSEPVEVATAPVDDIAAEFGINPDTVPEVAEPAEDEESEDKEDDDDSDDDKGGDNEGGASEDEEKEIDEDLNITNNNSPARVDNRDQSGDKPTEGEKTDEGILGAVGDVVGGVVDGVKNLLASDEAEKKDQANEGIIGAVKDVVGGVEKGVENILGEEKTDEGVGLFGVGDVNVNLDASGQNNAVGVGGGEGKTEGLLDGGLPTPPGLKVPGLTEESEEGLDDELFDDLKEPVSDEEVRDMMADLREPTEESLTEEVLDEGPINWLKNTKLGKFVRSKHSSGKNVKASDDLYDKYRIIAWKKSPASNTVARTQNASGNPEYALNITKDTIAEARDSAAKKSADKEHPIVDIFGIKDGKEDLLFSYFNGKDVTEAVRVNGDTTGTKFKDKYGYTGSETNAIFTLSADGKSIDASKTPVATSYKRVVPTEEATARTNSAEDEADIKAEVTKGEVKSEEQLLKNLAYTSFIKDSSGQYILVDTANKVIGIAKNTWSVGEFARDTSAIKDILKRAMNAASSEMLNKDVVLVAKNSTDTYKLLTIHPDNSKPDIAGDPSDTTKKDFYGFMHKYALTEAFSTAFKPTILEGIEDLDEQALSNHILNSLTTVYENVKGFSVTENSVNNNSFIVEGLITFKSGKTKPTKYVFTEAVKIKDTIVFKGINENLAKDGQFLLACSINNSNLIAEGFEYKYTVENKLIEGYTGK